VYTLGFRRHAAVWYEEEDLVMLPLVKEEAVLMMQKAQRIPQAVLAQKIRPA
jgi:hypothetical protein